MRETLVRVSMFLSRELTAWKQSLGSRRWERLVNLFSVSSFFRLRSKKQPLSKFVFCFWKH